MIMASTVEEKIYEKQVFKDGLRVVTEFGKSSKYFSNKETKDLFRLGPKNRSIVLEKLWKCSSDQLEIREFADTQGELREVLGYSRHDNLYDEQELPPRQDKTKSLMENKSPNGDKNQSRIALQDLSINKLNGQKVPAENPLTLTVAPIFKSYKRKPVVDNFSPDSTSGGTSLEGSNRRPVVITISDDEDDEVCRTYESNKELSTEPVSEICDPEETSNSIEGSVDSLGDQDSFSEDDDDSDDLKSFIDDGPLIYYNDSHSDLPCQDEVIDLVSDDEKAQSDNVNYGNNLVDLTMDQTSLELSAVVKNGLNNLPDSDACLSVNFEDNITFTDDLCSSHTSNPPNDHDDRSCMISETASGIDCIDNPRVELEISLNQHEKLLSVNNSKLQEYDDSECYDDEYNEGCPELAQLNNLVQFSKRSSTYLESVSLQDSIEKHIQSVSTEISCDNFAGNNPQEVSSQDEESQDSSNPIVIGKLVNGTSPTVFLEKFAVPDLFSPGTTVKSLVHSTSNYSIAYDNQVSVIAGMTDLLSENLPQQTPKDASYFVNNEQSYYDRVFVLAASTSKPCNTGTAARPSRRSSFLSGFVYCDSSQDSSCISQSEDQKDTIQRNIFSSDARRSVCSYRSSLLEDGHSPTKNDKERGSTLDLTARTLSPSVKQTDDVANELSVTTFDNSIEDLVNATKNIDLGEEKGGDWFIDKSNFRTSVDREFLSDKYCSQEDAILSPILLSNHCRRSENFMDMSTNHGNDSIRYSL